MDLITAVDNLWTNRILLWGDKQTSDLCLGAHLSAFLPAFLSKLDSTTQDRAITFWNHVVKDHRSSLGRPYGEPSLWDCSTADFL